MYQAGVYWLVNYRQLHFEKSATQRYSYTARNAKYLQIKQRAKRVRVSGTKKNPVWKTVTPPLGVLQWSGDMKTMVLQKPVEAFNIRATATVNKSTVRIPIPIPHAINPNKKGELTRFTRDELKQMNTIAMTFLKEYVAHFKVLMEKTLA